jgi:hypothetical protein
MYDNLSSVGFIYARENLDQGGFTRAIVTDKTNDFSRSNPEADAINRADIAKGLGNLFEFNNVLVHKSILHP